MPRCDSMPPPHQARADNRDPKALWTVVAHGNLPRNCGASMQSTIILYSFFRLQDADAMSIAEAQPG
jgi:hypothetical protein